MNNVSKERIQGVPPQGLSRFTITGIGLLACLPLLMAFPKGAGWLSGLLTIAGLLMLARQWNIFPLDWRFLAICLILPVSYLLNMLFMGWYLDYLSRPAHLLWAFVLYLVIGYCGISRRNFFYAACVASFTALGIALYEAVYLGHDRVFGLGQRWNAVPFGNFSMLFGFFCLSGAVIAWDEKPRLHVSIAIAGCLSGLVASILSGTRGGWVAFPFLIMLCFFMNDRLSRKTRGILFLLTTAAVLTVALSSERFQARLHDAEKQISVFMADPENPQARAGAVGIRLGMWYWGIKKFAEYPFTGIGIANYKQERMTAVETGVLPEEFNQLANLHNELITGLALGGLPSAAALILFWVLGWRFFYLRLKSEDREQQYFALCGLITVVGTALFSMTEGLFGTSPGTKAIMLCLAVPAGGLRYLYAVEKPILRQGLN